MGHTRPTITQQIEAYEAELKELRQVLLQQDASALEELLNMVSFYSPAIAHHAPIEIEHDYLLVMLLGSLRRVRRLEALLQTQFPELQQELETMAT